MSPIGDARQTPSTGTRAASEHLESPQREDHTNSAWIVRRFRSREDGDSIEMRSSGGRGNRCARHGWLPKELTYEVNLLDSMNQVSSSQSQSIVSCSHILESERVVEINEKKIAHGLFMAVARPVKNG